MMIKIGRMVITEIFWAERASLARDEPITPSIKLSTDIAGVIRKRLTPGFPISTLSELTPSLFPLKPSIYPSYLTVNLLKTP